MDCLNEAIVNLLKNEGKSVEEVFEMVNGILLKHGNRKDKEDKKKRKRRKPVCRPVLLISDSSCEEDS
tara:strand:- start:482 stop:685 length:204 start_codon:yes stop_codon:yes gene_type:complete